LGALVGIGRAEQSTRGDYGLRRSGGDLPQHAADDQPVERQDDRQIDPAEQIVRQHQRGRGDPAAVAGGCDIHHDAKIEVAVVEAGDEAIGRLAHNRKYPDDIGGAVFVRPGCLQAKRRHQKIAQPQQSLNPSRRVSQHSLGRLPRVDRCIVDRCGDSS